MDRFFRVVANVTLVSALAAAGCSSSSSATPSAGMPTTVQQQSANEGWVHKDGVTYHIPHYMGTRYMHYSEVEPDIQVVYRGGPVLVAPKMYLIIWGYKLAGDPNQVKPLLEQYARAIGGSQYNNIYTQYYQVIGGVQTYVTNPTNQFGAIWSDNANTVPPHPREAQVAAEAIRGVAHFGYDPNGSYVVATPHLHNSSGFGTSWCAYHSSTTFEGKVISYTDLPYMPDAGGSCGANFTSPPSDETSDDEGVTIVGGHEYGESVTDPNPFTGWYNRFYGEIGDICAWRNILNDPFGSKSYTSQPMFSNASGSCVHSYSPSQSVEPNPSLRSRADRGNVYISDVRGGVKILENTVYTPKGSITNGIVTPDGEWTDANKNLYVTNSHPNHNVVEYLCRTNQCGSSPSFTYSTGLMNAINVTTDRSGDVFVADFEGPTSGFVDEYAQHSNTLLQQCASSVGVYGVAIDSLTGNVFVAYGGLSPNGYIEEFKGGLAGCHGKILGAPIGSPGDLILDDHKNIVICDQTNHMVDVIAPPYSAISRTIGTGWADPFQPELEKRLGAMLLYVADPGNADVQVFNYPAGTLVTKLKGGSLVRPGGVTDTFNLVP